MRKFLTIAAALTVAAAAIPSAEAQCRGGSCRGGFSTSSGAGSYAAPSYSYAPQASYATPSTAGTTAIPDPRSLRPPGVARDPVAVRVLRRSGLLVAGLQRVRRDLRVRPDDGLPPVRPGDDRGLRVRVPLVLRGPGPVRVPSGLFVRVQFLRELLRGRVRVLNRPEGSTTGCWFVIVHVFRGRKPSLGNLANPRGEFRREAKRSRTGGLWRRRFGGGVKPARMKREECGGQSLKRLTTRPGTVQSSAVVVEQVE